MQSLVQLPAAAVQPVHDGMTTVCRVNVVEDAPTGACPQPALIPVRMSPVVPELEPLVDPLPAPDPEPPVAPLATPEPPVPLVAPDVLSAPLMLTPEPNVPLATPLVGTPEPPVPLATLPLVSEPVTPSAPLVEPLPEPLELALAPEPPRLSVDPPLQARAVKSATHGGMRSQAF